MLAEHWQPQFTNPYGKKMCGKKWNPYFCHPYFCHQISTPITFAPEPSGMAKRQQTFITEFAKDGRNTYGTFSQWDQPADPVRGLKKAIEAIKFEITVLAGKPTNLPYTSLGPLFKARDEFLAELRQHRSRHLHFPRVQSRSAHKVGDIKIRCLLSSQFTISCCNH